MKSANKTFLLPLPLSSKILFNYNRNMQKVLITGGAGFIGSNLCKRLLKDGFQVAAVDNLLTGAKNNIEPLLSSKNFTFYKHDITTPLPMYLEADFVFHLASPASPNAKSLKSYINLPFETMLVNSLGTFHLLEWVRSKNARFLFASTSEVYGNPLVSPQPETYFGNVNPCGIRSVYDEAKRFGEALTMGFKRKYNLDTRIVRIFNTYGPQMQPDDGRVISNFINQALANRAITVYGDGSQTRSCCYIDDLVEGLTRLMFNEKAKGEVVNIGNTEEKSILEIAKLVKQLTDSKAEIVFEPLPEDDPLQRKPDIQKARKLLAWEPKITLEQGLKKTIAYFQNL